MKVKRISPRSILYLLLALAFSLSLATIIVNAVKVSETSKDAQIQVSEDDYTVLCMVSQSVGEDITQYVMPVVSKTGSEIQDVVFNLYPEEYAAACKTMQTVDESLNLN